MRKSIGVIAVYVLAFGLFLPVAARGEGYTCSYESETHVLAFDMEIEDSVVKHLSIETDTKPAYTDCLLLVIGEDNAFSQEASSGTVTLTSADQSGCTIVVQPLLDSYDVIIGSRCKSHYCSQGSYMPGRIRVYNEIRPCVENPSPSS